jgi:nucleoside-diphosphate-sugar epimerase
VKGKILITGAAGFIGKRLSARLLKSGAEVRCLLRHLSPVPAELSGAEIVRGDLLDPASLEQAAKDVSAVLHCAALVRPRGAIISRREFLKTLEAVNRDGARNVAAAAAAAGAKLFLHLSSIAAQGPGVSLRETDPCRPMTLYGRSKLDSETAVMQGIPPGSSCRLVIARPAMIYGKDSPNWNKFFSAVRSGLVPVPGRGNNTLSVCWVESLVDALLLLAKSGEDRAAYTVSEGPRTWNDLARMSSEAIGVKAKILKVPEWPLALAAFLAGPAMRPAGLWLPAAGFLAEPGSFREAVANWGHDTTRLCALGWSPRLSTPEALAAELREAA